MNGSFGPPGFNAGPAGQAAVYRGSSDSAELESFFNKLFKSFGYPPGYNVFQHGGLSGTAGFFKKLKENFDLLGKPCKPGWSPGKDWDSEKLLVAVKGVSETNGVGYTNSWEALSQFHKANPMGEFRFTNSLPDRLLIIRANQTVARHEPGPSIHHCIRRNQNIVRVGRPVDPHRNSNDFSERNRAHLHF